MKRNFCLKVFFLIFCFFLCITSINAKECTTEEYRELKEIAKRIELNYQFINENNRYEDASFLINAYNLDSKLYLYIPYSDSYIYYTKRNETIFAISPGMEFKISVYASSKTNCEDEFLTNIRVEIPDYNKYFNRNECKQRPNVNICKKWYDSSQISEEEFLKIVNSYYKKEKNNFFEILVSFLKKHGILLLIISLIVCGIVLILNKIKNKNRNKIKI